MANLIAQFPREPGHAQRQATAAPANALTAFHTGGGPRHSERLNGIKLNVHCNDLRAASYSRRILADEPSDQCSTRSDAHRTPGTLPISNLITYTCYSGKRARTFPSNTAHDRAAGFLIRVPSWARAASHSVPEFNMLIDCDQLRVLLS